MTKSKIFLTVGAALFFAVSSAKAADSFAVGASSADPQFCAGNVARVTAKLNSIRSALSVYYGDTEGAYPKSLQQLVPKYLPAIPIIKLCDDHNIVVHKGVNLVTPVSGLTPTDAGGWAYVGNGPANPNWGSVFVNCAHTSPSHKPWYKF